GTTPAGGESRGAGRREEIQGGTEGPGCRREPQNEERHDQARLRERGPAAPPRASRQGFLTLAQNKTGDTFASPVLGAIAVLRRPCGGKPTASSPSWPSSWPVCAWRLSSSSPSWPSSWPVCAWSPSSSWPSSSWPSSSPSWQACASWPCASSGQPSSSPPSSSWPSSGQPSSPCASLPSSSALPGPPETPWSSCQPSSSVLLSELLKLLCTTASAQVSPVSPRIKLQFR